MNLNRLDDIFLHTGINGIVELKMVDGVPKVYISVCSADGKGTHRIEITMPPDTTICINEFTEEPTKKARLKAILNTMFIPPFRHKLTEDNLRWLSRNISRKNEENEKLNEARGLIKSLLRNEDFENE